MRRVHGQVVLIGAALLLLVLLGAAASGYWTVGGAGTGAAATTGTVQSLTLSPAVPSAHLYPGGRSAVTLKVTNPNSTPLRLGSLGLDTAAGTAGFGVDPAHSSCGVSSLSFTTQSNRGAGWTVPASGSLDINLVDALVMGLDAADACQGAVFTVHLKAGA